MLYPGLSPVDGGDRLFLNELGLTTQCQNLVITIKIKNH